MEKEKRIKKILNLKENKELFEKLKEYDESWHNAYKIRNQDAKDYNKLLIQHEKEIKELRKALNIALTEITKLRKKLGYDETKKRK